MKILPPKVVGRLNEDPNVSYMAGSSFLIQIISSPLPTALSSLKD